MTAALIKYEAACRALAECKAIDEVKSWHDKAAAMQAYGRMAKDKTLEVDAAEIRIRAERRLGEMLSSQKADGGLNKGKLKQGPVLVNDEGGKQPPKLADEGISYDLSSRAQKLAAVPHAEFEAEVGQWRERVSEENARVSARLVSAGEREQKKRQIESEKEDFELVELREAVSNLSSENERLSDRLAVEAMDASEEEKSSAAETIAGLRAQVKTLEAELSAVKASRDSYMREAVEAKKTAVYWRKQAERIAA